MKKIKDWYKYNFRISIREFIANILIKFISLRYIRELVYCHTNYTILDFSKLDYIVNKNINIADLIAEESESQIF